MNSFVLPVNPFLCIMKKNRRLRIFLHIGGWLMFLGLPVVFLASRYSLHHIGGALGSWQFVVFIDVYLLIYYLNYHLLIPKLALNRRIPLYVLSVIAIFVLLYFLRPFDRLMDLFNTPLDVPPPPPNGPPPGIHPPGGRMLPHFDIVSIFLGIVAIAAALVSVLQHEWQRTAMQLEKTRIEKLNAELDFLKARVNPHFLFNTLNNIYTLAEQKSDRTGESILRLSAIMRYVTDEMAAEKVPLRSELNCLEDLVALQQLRLNDKTRIDYSCNGTVEEYSIAPLVLVPFVENAFKFGVSNHQPSVITIQIDCDEQGIRFYCSNNVVNRQQETVRAGTGLDDVQKRLEYLYGKRHQLVINESSDLFEVILTLHK